MDRKQRIYEYIKSENYIPMSSENLMIMLDVPKNDTYEFTKILDELCVEGKIFLTKQNRYMAITSSCATVSGTLDCAISGFFGFLIPDDENEEKVFIPGIKHQGALHGDRVLVGIENAQKDSNISREGIVLRVLERKNEILTGVITKTRKHGYFVVKPDNARIYSHIYIAPEDMNGAQIDDRVSLRITQYSKNYDIFGSVEVILGKSDSLKGLIEAIIISHNIKQEFDDETMREASHSPEEITDGDTKNRVDLRNKLIFTIDGDDARDFDDAVSVDILPNGNFELGVHIADVTHYVKTGNALDSEAFLRGTSVYLADRVIPMLPQRLSNGICSLNPHVDRLTLSVTMEIDKSGNVVSHRLENTVINSKERMTYNKANAILNGDTKLCEEYSHIVPALLKMAELAKILEKKRDRRGAIQFDFPETQIICNEFGKPVDIKKAERGVSNKIIEEFMLCANETVAEYAFWADIPFVYRVHESPSEEKLVAFNNFIKPFGLSLKAKYSDENPLHPKELQKVLEQAMGTPEERMIAMTMLRSLMKAEYKTQNLGHFGLAARYYCHFTSPIRRYPDLTIHRILKCFIDGTDTSQYAEFVSDSARHSSETELSAEYAQRDVDDLMKAAYMSMNIGKSYEGVIRHLSNSGIFVELENSVEGFIAVENLTDDYYDYYKESFMLKGRHTSNEFRIGDLVCVTLMRSDIVTRRIDFVLERDATAKMFEKFRKKGKAQALIDKNKKGRQKLSSSRRKFVKKGRKNHNG